MDEAKGIGNGPRLISGRRLLLPVVVLAIAAAAWFAIRWRQNARFYAPASLLSRFPAEDGAALNIDFRALRAAGLLSDSKARTEPEYKQFMDGTGLDYRRDLDLALASFSKSGNYFIARGRFDWDKLRSYAIRQGGSCYQELCRMPGSTPERHISFLPLRKDTIAVAVSSDDLAASRLTGTGPPIVSRIPDAPVWLSVPGALLARPASLPGGVRLLLSSLLKAERIVITVGPEGSGIEARLDAGCRNVDDARQLASQLRSTTGMLKQALLTDKEAGQDELARSLASGTFDSAGPRVIGKWALAKNLLDSLTAGI